MNNTGIIILAAGRSARLGGIKQLLRFQDKTLLQHVIDEAIATGAAPVIVVTGGHAAEVSAAIDLDQVYIVFNEKWKEGKGSGIVAGVREIIASYPEVRNVILAVCDQPFVTAALFIRLFQMQHDGGKGIVACAYAGTVGTPVLFSRRYFEHLLSLEKEEGAKKIIAAYSDDVATVDFPEGEIDIDTPEDYERFLGV